MCVPCYINILNYISSVYMNFNMETVQPYMCAYSLPCRADLHLQLFECLSRVAAGQLSSFPATDSFHQEAVTGWWLDCRSVVLLLDTMCEQMQYLQENKTRWIATKSTIYDYSVHCTCPIMGNSDFLPMFADQSTRPSLVCFNCSQGIRLEDKYSEQINWFLQKW